MKKTDEIMRELYRVKTANAKQHKSIENYAVYLRSQEKIASGSARNKKVAPKAATV